MSFLVSDEIKSLVPYKPGQSEKDVKRKYNRDSFIKLASNESPLSPSKKVKEAVVKALDSGNLYPDPFCRDLSANKKCPKTSP